MQLAAKYARHSSRVGGAKPSASPPRVPSTQARLGKAKLGQVRLGFSLSETSVSGSVNLGFPFSKPRFFAFGNLGFGFG